MKKVLFGMLLMTVALTASAQTNPKPGFIITNAGDTIRGIIDFRTNENLSKQCVFWANEGAESTTYKPGDIEGFRFEDGGKYFVTRRLNVTGDPQLYFAEFMVQGKMNLYCIVYNRDEYFFFEREDGEMALLTNRAFLTSSSLQNEMDKLEEKKDQYGRVKLLLKDSWKAIQDMNEKDMSRKRLVNVVRDYHNDVCTDGSTCMVYEYKEESDKAKTHFKAFTGFAYYSHERTVNQNLQDETYHGGVFEIGLGVETDIDRVMKGGSMEIGLAYSPKTSFEHDVMVRGGHEPSHTIYEKGRVTASIGIVKRFGNGKKIQPLVRGGGFYVLHFGNHETRYYMSKQMIDLDWDNTAHFGIYLGGGAQMAVGKHYARLHADWYKSFESSKKANMMKWGLTAEFAL
jgi:hypothetical protein